mmetsp:Transcript_37443/g.67403  ORF Transcript_37443/g.67403 Transcript_37443/m.67403 type:complete len:138 (-) Transcript_37443:159-572(-)
MKLNWIDVNRCVADSQGISFHTNKFYVDYPGMKCARDCDATNPLPCMGNPTDATATLFNTGLECCESITWWNLAECVAKTNGVPPLGSGQWYNDGGLGFCVQDCVGPAPCGGLKENWETGHASKSVCCSFVPWNPSC